MNTCVTLRLLDNDYDPNGDPISVIPEGGIQDPPHGVINFIDYTNGIIQYCPDANWCGIDEFTYTIQDNPRSQDAPCTATAIVRIDVPCPKEEVPAILLFPLVDIERLTITRGPVIVDGNINSLIESGIQVVVDGKVIAAMEIIPGTQSMFAQVENRGFVTQAGVMVRFEGLPAGVSYTLEPPSQKIKAHNIGTYIVTMTASPDVGPGEYLIRAVAYTRSGTLDTIDLKLVIT
jgi:hypothetical protein